MKIERNHIVNSLGDSKDMRLNYINYSSWNFKLGLRYTFIRNK